MTALEVFIVYEWIHHEVMICSDRVRCRSERGSIDLAIYNALTVSVH